MAKYNKRKTKDAAALQTMQKNRFEKPFKNRPLSFGKLGLRFIQEGLLEFRHALMFKRVLKKLIKKGKRKMTRK
jgi:hypothetical protein